MVSTKIYIGLPVRDPHPECLHRLQQALVVYLIAHLLLSGYCVRCVLLVESLSRAWKPWATTYRRQLIRRKSFIVP